MIMRSFSWKLWFDPLQLTALPDDYDVDDDGEDDDADDDDGDEDDEDDGDDKKL